MSKTNYLIDITVYYTPGSSCDIFLADLVTTLISLPVIEVFVAFGSQLKCTQFFKWCGVQHQYFTGAE